MSSSVIQSETSTEHTDLIKYECNLASCYEAEYMLSLKLQEERSGEDGNTTSSYMYWDDYEVTGTPNCSVEKQEGVCAQVPNGMDNEYLSTGFTKSLQDNSNIDMATPTIIADSSQFNPEAMDCGISIRGSSHCEDDYPLSNLSPHCYCIDNEACSFRGNVHCEGPARKRLCLDEDKS